VRVILHFSLLALWLFREIAAAVESGLYKEQSAAAAARGITCFYHPANSHTHTQAASPAIKEVYIRGAAGQEYSDIVCAHVVRCGPSLSSAMREWVPECSQRLSSHPAAPEWVQPPLAAIGCIITTTLLQGMTPINNCWVCFAELFTIKTYNALVALFLKIPVKEFQEQEKYCFFMVLFFKLYMLLKSLTMIGCFRLKTYWSCIIFLVIWRGSLKTLSSANNKLVENISFNVYFILVQKMIHNFACQYI
jgi:hypothetical protein